MKVVLYGATGKAGSRILKELVRRGHTVVAVARNINVNNLPAGVEAVQDDLSDVSKIAAIITGADVLVSAYAPPFSDTGQLVAVTGREIAAVKKAGSNIRLVVVGGAGSLEVAPGMILRESSQFPPEWVPIAIAHEKALQLLRASDINWTSLSPAALFEPGERAGKYRLGTDNLVSNDKGESRISMEDYAIALVDELEKPAHERARFSVGW